MTANEIFGRLDAEQGAAVLDWLLGNDREAYKNCASLLATRRKLRPIFVERKPRSEKNLWMKEALSRQGNADLALEILQIWTLGCNEPMVCEFLDHLNIPHNGKGLIDELPKEPDAEKIRGAVDLILSNHSQVAVFVYLNLFSGMDPEGWPILRGIIESDSRLTSPALATPL